MKVIMKLNKSRGFTQENSLSIMVIMSMTAINV